MTASTELEMRPLEAHELDIVNGGTGIPAQQVATSSSLFSSGPSYGPVYWDAASALWPAWFPRPRSAC